MELCEARTLDHYLKDRNKINGPIDRKQNFSYFNQIVEAIKHCHEVNIIHRDLKPANIFIDKKNQVKIGDFGLAREYEMAQEPDSAGRIKPKKDSDGFEQSLLSAKVGTPFYLSPEQKEDKGYDEKVDIFSLGLILFELCSNFKTMHQRSMKHK